MSEHLPVISEASLMVMVEKELPYFIELLKRCSRGADSPSEVIERMFSVYEMKDSNPLLVKALRGAAYGVAGELEGEVEDELRWRAGVATVLGVLVALRLIDRELEAKELEKKLR